MILSEGNQQGKEGEGTGQGGVASPPPWSIRFTVGRGGVLGELGRGY